MASDSRKSLCGMFVHQTTATFDESNANVTNGNGCDHNDFNRFRHILRTEPSAFLVVLFTLVFVPATGDVLMGQRNYFARDTV